jgi:hypothetical protein
MEMLATVRYRSVARKEERAFRQRRATFPDLVARKCFTDCLWVRSETVIVRLSDPGLAPRHALFTFGIAKATEAGAAGFLFAIACKARPRGTTNTLSRRTTVARCAKKMGDRRYGVSRYVIHDIGTSMWARFETRRQHTHVRYGHVWRSGHAGMRRSLNLDGSSPQPISFRQSETLLFAFQPDSRGIWP